MAKPVIYVHRLGPWYTRYMDDANEALLGSFATVVSGGTREAPMSPGELIEAMRGAQAILSLNGTGAPEITTEVLQAVGTVRVAAISHWFHGAHDRARAMWEAAGVRVIDVFSANTEAVAEWTLTAMLLGVRRLLGFDQRLKAGVPWGEPRYGAGMLCESVVGLVGLGRIGQHVARLLCALGATVIGYDRYVSPETAAEMGVNWTPLEELLRTADVLSFHLPVTDETKRMFGARELGWIKDGAVFVNSARNLIFDDAALVAEIQKQRFTAYLDVFEVEPLPLDHPYRSLPNMFITPHIAGDNMVMFRRCGRLAIEALREALASSGS
jgi:phosphoglycerate dehydrogenase-like enzyme